MFRIRRLGKNKNKTKKKKGLVRMEVCSPSNITPIDGPGAGVLVHYPGTPPLYASLEMILLLLSFLSRSASSSPLLPSYDRFTVDLSVISSTIA